MRAVIQRVTEASVSINGNTQSSIKKGLLIFLGVEESDTTEDLIWLSAKISGMRIFPDNHGLMNLSVSDINGDVLIVSQFTLLASTRKGNRPSFVKAAKHEVAIKFYEMFCLQMERDLSRKVKTGVFAADMKISLVNDGPVTIIIDSKIRE